MSVSLLGNNLRAPPFCFSEHPVLQAVAIFRRLRCVLQYRWESAVLYACHGVCSSLCFCPAKSTVKLTTTLCFCASIFVSFCFCVSRLGLVRGRCHRYRQRAHAPAAAQRGEGITSSLCMILPAAAYANALGSSRPCFSELCCYHQLCFVCVRNPPIDHHCCPWET